MVLPALLLPPPRRCPPQNKTRLAKRSTCSFLPSISSGNLEGYIPPRRGTGIELHYYRRGFKSTVLCHVTYRTGLLAKEVQPRGGGHRHQHSKHATPPVFLYPTIAKNPTWAELRRRGGRGKAKSSRTDDFSLKHAHEKETISPISRGRRCEGQAGKHADERQTPTERKEHRPTCTTGDKSPKRESKEKKN